MEGESEMLSPILYVLLYLTIGSALKYLLPYVIEGLVQIGLKNPWPKWEWRYLSSFALAIIGFGLPIVTVAGFFTQLADLPQVPLIAFAYAGNEMSRVIVKAIERLAKSTET